ncbi:MAG: cysteine hydrolase [Acidobacteriota bacterium]|nr:cysteine hydrolase [Acidobacteriota bacterium]
MQFPGTVLWGVDMQRDFMLPGGSLYVPHAENLVPNIRRLTNVAREGRAFFVSHGCFHVPNDPEFATFPPHCVQGTPGSQFIPEALVEGYKQIPNEPGATLPEDLSSVPQIILEKQTLDIFQSRHAGELVEHLGMKAEFVVFGVVTEYCVRLAAKGLLQRERRVTVIADSIETLSREASERTIIELKTLGANFLTTNEAFSKFRVNA